MLLTIAAVLIIIWLLGFFAIHITSFFIHLLLIAAVVVFIYHFVAGRKTQP